jgi:hypothetical protein
MSAQPQLTTLPKLAREAGVSYWTAREAVRSGALTPVGRAGRQWQMFTPAQVAEVRKAAGLLTSGIGLTAAIRVVRAGWNPPPELAA